MKLLAVLSLALSATAFQIRDPKVLEPLRKREAAVLDLIARGETVPIRAPFNASKVNADGVPVINLGIIGGWALVSTTGLGMNVLESIAEAFWNIFFSEHEDAIWHNTEYCRTYFETQGGGNCEIRTYERGSGDRTATHHPEGGCAWPDAPDGNPRSNQFDDPGIGKYSVFFTATNDHTFQGVEDPSTCSIEGICNPHYIFYRDGYEILLDSWKQEGVLADCQYSNGDDCGGVCSTGVKNQFPSGGVVWGGDCAIPCLDDAGLPDAFR